MKSKRFLLVSVSLSLLILAPPAWAAPPSVGTITPANGSSAPDEWVTITTTYTDPDGWWNLRDVRLLINTRVSGKNAVYLRYFRLWNRLYLRDDSNQRWLGNHWPGSNKIVENSQVRLDVRNTTVTRSGKTLTVRWRLSFKEAFAGNHNSYLWALDLSRSQTGWIKRGTWTVSSSNNPPSVGTIIPLDGSSDPNRWVTIASTYTDPDGSEDLKGLRLLLNTSLSENNAAYLIYDQDMNTLSLRGDTSGWLGRLPPGTQGIVENSQVRLDLGNTTVASFKENLMVNWRLSFKQSFSNKTHKCYLIATDDKDSSTGWVQLGTWTLPAKDYGEGEPPGEPTRIIQATTPVSLDVDKNGHITPLDVLTIINYLNYNGAGPTPQGREHLDVNKDGYIAPLDVLIVINYLNNPTPIPLMSVKLTGPDSTSTAQVKFSWVLTDPTIQVIKFRWRLKRPDGSFSNWLSQDAPSITLTQEVSSPGSYTLELEAQYGGAYWSGTMKHPFLIDRTPPSTPVVTDDGRSTTSNDKLHATWSSSDPESGIAEYQYAIGTTPTATNVVSWTSAGTSTEVTHIGLTLANGQDYFFSVKALNRAGSWSNIGTSDGIRVDTTPPTGTIQINDDAEYTSSTAVTLKLSITDIGSGVDKMSFSNDNTNYTDPEDFSATKPWTLSSGDGTKTVYAKFKDTVGNWSSPVSDSITLDSTPPVLRWTGEDGYTDDGLDPDTGYGDTNFQFRIKYSDNANNPPTVHKVHIDKNGDRDFEGQGEANDMLPQGDDYTKGVIYSYSTTIPYSRTSDKIKYYFEFSDGLNAAQGDIPAGYSPQTAIDGPLVLQRLSISISPNAWDIGDVDVGTTATMGDDNKLTVTNDGDGEESYSLCLTSLGGWMTGAQQAPETFVLNAAFSQGSNNINWSEENHLVTPQQLTSTQTRFAGNQNGVNVPPGESRDLYLQFKAPTRTQVIDPQSITLTISAEIPAR